MNKEVEGFLSRNYDELRLIAKKITKNNQDYEDLLQEVIIQLYQKKEIKLKKYDDDSIRYYITAIMRINYNSRTSPFYYKIKKTPESYLEFFYNMDYEPLYDSEWVDEDIAKEKEEFITKVEILYNDLPLVEKSVFDMYIDKGRIRRVSKETGISIKSINRYIDNVRTIIKNNINE